MRRLMMILALPLFLAACGGGADNVWATDAELAKYRVSTGEPPSVTLFTVISEDTGAGGHSALMINGNERIIFDPAGSWVYPYAPERHDVHFGMSEWMRVFYIDYHVRPTYYMVEQKVPVSAQTAAYLQQVVMANGPVGKMFCATSISRILADTPGFESIGTTMMPVSLMKQFAELPGVTREEYHDGDPRIAAGIKLIYPEKPKHESVFAKE